jgi:hypothetical protein
MTRSWRSWRSALQNLGALGYQVNEMGSMRGGQHDTVQACGARG